MHIYTYRHCLSLMPTLKSQQYMGRALRRRPLKKFPPLNLIQKMVTELTFKNIHTHILTHAHTQTHIQ